MRPRFRSGRAISAKSRRRKQHPLHAKSAASLIRGTAGVAAGRPLRLLLQRQRERYGAARSSRE